MTEAELIIIIENLKKSYIDFNIELFNTEEDKIENLHQTLSAFSNAKGGYIIFGISAKNKEKVIGINNYEELKETIIKCCRQMSPIIEPEFKLFNIMGKKILSLYVKEIDDSLKPCYYVEYSNVGGAFIRKGHNNIELNKLDMFIIKKQAKGMYDDIRSYPNIDYHELDEVIINRHIDRFKETNPETKGFDYLSVLDFCKITQDSAPTLLGILLFAREPGRFFPGLHLETNVYDELGNNVEKQIFNGNVFNMLEKSLEYITYKTRHIGYPSEAIVEAIKNAVIHRDYSSYSITTPIVVNIYPDKLVFKNPGGLPEDIKISDLGKVNLPSLNPSFKNLLTLIDDTHDSMSGIERIRKSLRSNSFVNPEFVNKSGSFSVIFYAEPQNQNNEILNFCSQARDIREIKNFLHLETKYYTMNEYLKPLIDEKKLLLTVPEFPTSKFQKYIASKDQALKVDKNNADDNDND